MATLSSIPAWEIPWTKEPGGLVHNVVKEPNTTQQLNNNIPRVLHQSINFLVNSLYPTNLSINEDLLNSQLLHLSVPSFSCFEPYHTYIHTYKLTSRSKGTEDTRSLIFSIIIFSTEDQEAWHAAVHVVESQTQLSN